MYMRNSNGPNIPSPGELLWDRTGAGSDDSPAHSTTHISYDRLAMPISNPSVQWTLYATWGQGLKSRMQTSTYLWWSRDWNISSMVHVVRKSCVSHEWPFLKPSCCFGVSSHWWSINPKMCLQTMCSSSLQATQVREMLIVSTLMYTPYLKDWWYELRHDSSLGKCSTCKGLIVQGAQYWS